MKTIPAQWKTTILVCRKCSKRAGGGFGKDGHQSLAKALRAKGNGKKGRKASAGIVDIGCQKVCPKNAIVVVDTATPRQWLIVPTGTDIDVVAERLNLDDDRQAES